MGISKIVKEHEEEVIITKNVKEQVPIINIFLGVPNKLFCLNVL